MELVPDDLFDQLDSVFDAAASGADAAPQAFQLLLTQLEAAKQHAHVFELQMMRKRHEFGLPLAGDSGEIPAPRRAEWETHVAAVARHAGEAFLSAGEIARAWPYFRALADPAPVKAAIEALPAASAKDDVIEVALYERVAPVKGYEMVLETHGSCRAITCLDQYPDPETRDAALERLTASLHNELMANLARVIEKQEGAAPPEGTSMAALLEGRDWLFGEYDYYIDTSHIMSALRFAVESASPVVWRRALDFAEYGQRLAPMFHYAGEPPFEKPFADHAMFLRGLLGIEVDASIRHFRNIAGTADPERIGTYPAQVLVRYLVRLERPAEAIEVFERHLLETDAQYLTCPNLTQLCQLAGDHERLRRVARGRGDVLSYLAGFLLK